MRNCGTVYCRIACWSAALSLGMFSWEAPAANNWYTARTINGRTRPLSAGTAFGNIPPTDYRTATITNGLIDIVISLDANPAGDGDGNTQDVDPGSIAQDAYEKIIQYFCDGVYEATEGCHQIRNVRIYLNAGRADVDVIWRDAGQPCAWYMNQESIAASIKMFTKFSGHAFTNAASQDVGGYALAHEFGHYFYGLLDEYCRWEDATGWTGLLAAEKTRPCIMNDQWQAANRTYRWLNHSILSYTNAAGGYPDYACRPRTAQFQHYGDGGWVTLARDPATDPLDTPRRQWLRNNRGTRMYYPELAAVAPIGVAEPRLDLSAATPLTNLVSRQRLNIIWMQTNVAMQLIIDKSTSMLFSNKMDIVKNAAKFLVDQVPDGTALGVLAYNDLVQTVVECGPITTTVQRATIKAAIDNIQPEGWTAIGDATIEGLRQIEAYGTPGLTRVIFLLSDGQSTTGADPLAAAAACQNAQVPIMAFGYGARNEIDPRLIDMADLTGGRYYYSAGTLVELAAAFQDAWSLSAARQNLANGVVRGGARALTVNVPFVVDDSIAELRATVGHALTDTVQLTLNAPGGAVYHPGSTNENATERLLDFTVQSPVTGTWTIAGVASDNASLRYQVNAGVSNFSYHLTAVSISGNGVVQPAPIEIVASLSRAGTPIKGAVVTATIEDQFGNTTVLPLVNRSGGVYARAYATSNGVYNITVRADNSDGTAMFTLADALPAADEDGNLPEPQPDEPVDAPFTRTAALQVTVTGTQDASVPAAPASVTASAGDYQDYVRITWTPVTNAAGYELWRDGVKIAEINRDYTNCFDADVAVASQYSYQVGAVNAGGTGALSVPAQGWPLFGPAIRVNNARTATLAAGLNAEVTVLLRTGQYAGYPCDWWVAAYDASAGAFYCLDSALQWAPAADLADMRPVYSGAIFDITEPFTVLSYAGLPAGDYYFYFGLDTNMDGRLDVNALHYDMAVVQIR